MQKTIKQIREWDADWGRRFPVRIGGKQKERFVAELQQALHERHFETDQIIARNFLRSRLLVTQCARPDVIFLAHYDTPTILPFWISAIFHWFGHTRQITGTLCLIALLYAPATLSAVLSPNSLFVNLLVIIFYAVIIISSLTLFIPNPHNREDNTSGVIGLMALADWLQDKPEIRQRVQLAFLDNEEWGLLGSALLKRLWDKWEHPYGDALIINLDCVSRGQKPLLVHHGKDVVARQLLPYLQHRLPETKMVNMSIIPLSDNFTFRKAGAVDISFADPSLIPGGYYIPRIHTPADNTFLADRTRLLVQALTDFLQRPQDESAFPES